MPRSGSVSGRRAIHTRKARRVAVIIPVFNQASLTAQCLRILLGRDACEVIVVDDASTDATPSLLDGYRGRIKVVTHARNAGFARSCNHGAAAAAGQDYLVFLNNDTLPQPGWLEALLDYAEAHPQAAVVGGKLLFPNNTIQHAGVVICQDRYPRHIYTGFPAAHPAVNRARPFQIVTAACMLVRGGVFESAGGFDPAFRNGFEDVDLCLRLGEQGKAIHYCPESVVYHFESVSPGRFTHDRQNVARYRKRWMARVRPDDVDYYLEDGLLRLDYEGHFPISVEISPLLATLEGVSRRRSLERQLRERSREVTDLLRENARLQLELGRHDEDSPERCYRQLRERIRELVRKWVPPGATVLVISKGDGALLQLPGCRAWHFPRTDRGAYAGHHPAGSSEAIAHLETLRAQGGGYLVIPATARWWLDHYAKFRQHLETRYVRLGHPGDPCWIYALGGQNRSSP